jgi:hypothetical protein
VNNNSKRRFIVDEDQFENKWEYTKDKYSEMKTGDATVPFEGAVPPFKGLTKDELVCVSRSDIGIWDLLDQAGYNVVGFHGLLPRVNMVQRLVVKHLFDDPAKNKVYKAKTQAKPAPDCFETWDPPIPLYDKKNKPFGLRKEELKDK